MSDHNSDHTTPPVAPLITRSRLLRAGAVGAAATVIAGGLAVTRSGDALADGPATFTTDEDGTPAVTALSTPFGTPAIKADAGAATILASSHGDNNDATIIGLSDTSGMGVLGFVAEENYTGGYHSLQTDGYTGVVGIGLQNLNGVHGVSYRNRVLNQDTMILGDGIGVRGRSGTNFGVYGESRHGRGGGFGGEAAAIRLIPSDADAPPASGQTGDLFVDSSGRLWFCTAGGDPADWRQVQLS